MISHKMINAWIFKHTNEIRFIYIHFQKKINLDCRQFTRVLRPEEKVVSRKKPIKVNAQLIQYRVLQDIYFIFYYICTWNVLPMSFNKTHKHLANKAL